MLGGLYIIEIEINFYYFYLLLLKLSLIHSSCFNENAVLLKLREVYSMGISSLAFGEMAPLVGCRARPLSLMTRPSASSCYGAVAPPDATGPPSAAPVFSGTMGLSIFFNLQTLNIYFQILNY